MASIGVSFIYDPADEVLLGKLEKLFIENGIVSYRLASMDHRDANYDYDLKNKIQNSRCLIFLKTNNSRNGRLTPTLNKQLRVAREEGRQVFIFTEHNPDGTTALDPKSDDPDLRALISACPELASNVRPLERHFLAAFKRVCRFLLYDDDSVGSEIYSLGNDLASLSSSQCAMAASITALQNDLTSANRKLKLHRAWIWVIGLLLFVLLGVTVFLGVRDHYLHVRLLEQAGRDVAREKADHAATRAKLGQAEASESLLGNDLIAAVADLDKQRKEYTQKMGIKMLPIKAGKFEMGSNYEEGEPDEEPRHPVTLTHDFYLSETEITQGQYQKVMGDNPSHFKWSDSVPVENVSWFDAIRFCNRLSELEGRKPYYLIEGETVTIVEKNGDGYRLPTEAEWEYACRAGSITKYSFGNNAASLGEYAWFDGNSKVNGELITHPVRQRQPNAWGLHDMHGNVWEWCWDWYGKDYYKISINIDPVGPDTGKARVLRGGSFDHVPGNLRSADRNWLEPATRDWFYGFRPARTYP